MVSATRLSICFTERSRWGVPSVPRKYFCTTALVAVWLQEVGNSTSFCSKYTLPSAPLMDASRSSQLTSSSGSIPARVKYRSKRMPGFLTRRVGRCAALLVCALTTSACDVVCASRESGPGILTGRVSPRLVERASIIFPLSQRIYRDRTLGGCAVSDGHRQDPSKLERIAHTPSLEAPCSPDALCSAGMTLVKQKDTRYRVTAPVAY